ncbi:hypothetical protein AAG570_013750 [Ranatra chinensis]|uniref:N-acetyltransferase domain-containing protein n=1 Tax=Ranatra chinensis TaxID=642074 RepID=A0ABD0YD31_9HEMI
MRLNSCIKICCKNVVLVPYRKRHVEKYHTWMESETLRKQTASERLNLEEEYEMQQTWLNDENKCTFIVLDAETWNHSSDETKSMIGDANLYIKKNDTEVIGEVGVMIADKNFRGRGLGREAALLILRYGAEEIKVNKFQAIISMDNVISVNMFKKFKFCIESESAVFNEVTLSRHVDSDWLEWVRKETSDYKLSPTEPNA